MIADDSMHVVGVPMDTLGTEIRRRYNRGYRLPPEACKAFERLFKSTDDDREDKESDNLNTNT